MSISLPYGVGTLDLEDLKVPYLSISMFENVRTR
jgi:hypothetical protein